MPFVKVETQIPEYRKDKTVIINTDRILTIQKDAVEDSYLVQYDAGDAGHTPRFFDRTNAQIIFNAIGASLD